MCDVIEAQTAAAARHAWALKFWADPDELRAAIPTMDALNKQAAEDLLQFMEAVRAEARLKGIRITARLSRAKTR